MSLTDRQIEAKFTELGERVTTLENKLAGAEGRIAVLVERENERVAEREHGQLPSLQIHSERPAFKTPVQKARGNRPVGAPGGEEQGDAA